MTPNEIISISIAAIALIVAWFARQDSNKLAKEALRANDLLERHLELATNEQNSKIQKTKFDDVPVLMCKTNRISSGDSSHTYCEVEILNLGGDLFRPEIETIKGIRAKTGGFLMKNQSAKITFSTHPRFALPFHFYIRGVTSHGYGFQSGLFCISGGLDANYPTRIEEVTQNEEALSALKKF